MTFRLKFKMNLLLIHQMECEVIEFSMLILIAYYVNTKNK
jgi:hypothetical protein